MRLKTKTPCGEGEGCETTKKRGGFSSKRRDELRGALNVTNLQGKPVKYGVENAEGYRTAVRANLKKAGWPEPDIETAMGNLTRFVDFKEMGGDNGRGFKAFLARDFQDVCGEVFGAEVAKTN